MKFQIPDSPSHRERHKYFIGRARDYVENNFPVFVRRGNVQKTKFVRAFTIVDSGDLDRIAGVPEAEKFHSLDDASRIYVETWNDPLGEHKEP